LRSPSIESFLKKHGITFDYSTVPIDKVLVDEATKENIRPGQSLNEDVVLRYSICKEQGDDFPPIITFQSKNGKLGLVDGVHRIHAWKLLGLKEIEAYNLTTAAPADIELLQRITNIHTTGFGVGREHQLMQAAHLVEQGLTIGVAAATCGVTTSKLTRYLAAIDTARLIAEASSDAGRGLSEAHLQALHPLRYSVPHVIQAATLAHHLRYDEFQGLTRSLLVCKSDKERDEVLRLTGEAIAARTRQPKPRVKNALTSMLLVYRTSIQNYRLRKDLIDRLGRADRDRMMIVCDEIVEAAQALRAVLK